MADLILHHYPMSPFSEKVRLILGQPGASAWRKAAVWHSRDTHDALVNHWQAHGPDPVIERALRAGCLVMNAAAGPVH